MSSFHLRRAVPQSAWALVVASLVLPLPATAGEQSARTTDGRDVILRDDGTWIFKPKPTGVPITVGTVKLELGGPFDPASYACKRVENATGPRGEAVYDCQIGGKAAQVTVAATLRSVELAGKDALAFDASLQSLLGNPLGETSEGADCPWTTTRYMVGGIMVQIVRSDGCYEDEEATPTRAISLVP